MNKILIINGYYFPSKNYGGPSTSVFNLVSALKDDFDFYIVAKNHDYGNKEVFSNIKEGWNELNEGGHILYLSDEEYNYVTFYNLVKQLKIDLIYVSGFYFRHLKNPLWLYRKTQKPVVIAPKGELNGNALKIQAFKKKIYIFLARLLGIYSKLYFHSTCEEEFWGLRKKIGISEDRILQIENIPVGINHVVRSFESKAPLKIMSVGRVCEIKNNLEMIRCIVNANIPCIYDIYGNIEDKEYYQNCMKAVAENKSSNIKINFKGGIDHQEILNLYKDYEIFFSLTKSENYGQAIAEALANGCRVILSKGTTPWDDIDGYAGIVVPLENIGGISDYLNYVYHLNVDERKQYSQKVVDFAEQRLNITSIKEKYIHELNRLVSQFCEK